MMKNMKKLEEKGKRFFASPRGKKVAGGAVGVINGLFGSGGGMVVVPVLRAGGMDQHQAQATSLAVVLPLSVLSLLGYGLGGSIPGYGPYAALGAAAGGAAGAWLSGKIPSVWLARIFDVLMFAAGVRMLF